MPVSDLTSARSAWKSSSPKANSRSRRVVVAPVSRAGACVNRGVQKSSTLPSLAWSEGT